MIKKTALLILLSISLASVAQKNKKDEIVSLSSKDLESEASFVEGMKFFLAENYEKAITLFKKSLDKNTNSAGGHFMTAKAFLALNDMANATVYGEKALKLDDNNKFLKKFLGEVYTKQKRYKEAISIYEKLADRFPQDIDNFLDLSNTYILQEKYSDAIDIYNKIEKNIGVSEDITRQKQLIFLKQNKLEKAIEEGDKLIASEPAEPEYVVQQAQILISNERYDQAVKMLEKTLQKNPDFAQAHVLLAEIYRKQNNIEKCNQELQIAFANKNLPNEIKFKILGSYMLMLKEDYGEKTLENLLSLTSELIKQSPKEARGYVVLGDLLMKKGELAAARDNYVKATDFDKSIFEVWSAILELDSKLNHIDSLAKHSEQAVEYFPNQANFWYFNGFASFVKKRFDKAVESLEEARNLAVEMPELQKHVNALLGDTFNEMRQYAKSDEAYEAVLKIDAEYESVLNNYSYFLALRKDKLAKAAQLSAKLVEKNPDNATYLDTHAWVLYTMKDYQKAKEVLEKAIKQPKNVSGTIIEHYGDVLYQLGEKEKAIEQWKKARQMGENSQNIEKKIQSGSLIE